MFTVNHRWNDNKQLEHRSAAVRVFKTKKLLKFQVVSPYLGAFDISHNHYRHSAEEKC